MEDPKTLLNANWPSIFEGEDFSRSNLASVHPTAFSFRRCDFSGADLRLATFEPGVYFTFCDFTGANLVGASLRGAEFTACVFTDADLSNCDLTGAKFTHSGGNPPTLTDLTRARLAGANLKDVEMEQVIGWG